MAEYKNPFLVEAPQSEEAPPAKERGYVNPFTVEKAPLPEAKPAASKAEQFGVDTADKLGEIHDWLNENLGPYVGSFTKKAIPLPDSLLERGISLERPGSATLGGSRRPPVLIVQYPTREETEGQIGKLGRSMSESGGAALNAGTLLNPLIGAAARAYTGARPVVAGVLNSMAAPFRTAPVTTLAADATLGTLGGTTQGLAEEAGVENPALLSMTNLLGSLSPIAALSGARAARNALPDNFGKAAAGRGARDMIKENTETGNVSNQINQDANGTLRPVTWADENALDAAQRAAPNIPGWQPETATLLDSPFLLGVARQADRAERVRDNSRALRGYVEEGVPEGNPDLPGKVAERKLQQAKDTTRKEATNVREEGQSEAELIRLNQQRLEGERLVEEARARRSIPEDTNPEVTKEAASRRQAELLTEQERAAREHGGQLFEEVTSGFDPKDLKVGLYNYRNSINKVKALAEEEGGEYALPKGMKDVVDAQGNTTGKYLEDFLGSHDVSPDRSFVAQAPYLRAKGLRERLSEEMRDPTLAPKTRRYLSMIMSGLESDIENSLPQGVQNNYRAARENWRENVVGRFQHPEEGAPNPNASVLEGKTAGDTYVKRGEQGGRSADAFVNAFGVEPHSLASGTPGSEAHNALRQWVLAHAGRKSEQIEKFVTDYGPFLERFPSLRQELNAAVIVRRRADAAAEAAKANEAGARKGATDAERTGEQSAAELERRANQNFQNVPGGTKSIYAELGGRDESEVARTIKSSKDALRVKRAFKNEPEAWAGFQRAYYDHATDKILPAGSEGAVKPETLARWLRDNRDTARTVLGEDGVARLDRVSRAVQMGMRTSNYKDIPGASDTQPLLRRGIDLAAQAMGTGKPAQLALSTLSAFGVKTRKDALDLLKKAATDPDVFREVMRTPDRIRKDHLGFVPKVVTQAAKPVETAEQPEGFAEGGPVIGTLWQKLLQGEANGRP